MRPRVVASIIAFALASPAAMTAELHGYQVPGTYQLSICNDGCSPYDPRTAFSTVVVVLSMRPLSEQEPRPPGDGCFAVTNLGKSSSYAQRETLGKTTWTIENGRLKFALFHSADAGYFVELELKDNEVRGVGISRGAGADRKKDRVVGHWMGSPNPAECKPWKPVPVNRQKFIPYSPLDAAQTQALAARLRSYGIANVPTADLTRDLYDNHTFHDDDIFKVFPQLRGQQKLSECSNRMMTNATELVFLESRGKNEVTLEKIRCNGEAKGIRCPEPARGQYHFLDGTDQYFSLDGLTFETAKAILAAYEAGRISELPEWMQGVKPTHITSIKALFGNRYQLIFGEYFCSGCATLFTVDFETTGEPRLTIVGQPDRGCY